MGWKTILGTVIAGAGAAAQGGFSLESILTGAGIIIAGVGARHAIAKGPDPLLQERERARKGR